MFIMHWLVLLYVVVVDAAAVVVAVVAAVCAPSLLDAFARLERCCKFAAPTLYLHWRLTKIQNNKNMS